MVKDESKELTQMEVELLNLDDNLNQYSFSTWTKQSLDKVKFLSMKNKHEELAERIKTQKLITAKNREKATLLYAINIILIEIIIIATCIFFSAEPINAYVLLLMLTSTISFAWIAIAAGYKLLIISLITTFPDNNDRTTLIIAFFGTIISLISLLK